MSAARPRLSQGTRPRARLHACACPRAPRRARVRALPSEDVLAEACLQSTAARSTSGRGPHRNSGRRAAAPSTSSRRPPRSRQHPAAHLGRSAAESQHGRSAAEYYQHGRSATVYHYLLLSQKSRRQQHMRKRWMGRPTPHPSKHGTDEMHRHQHERTHQVVPD